MKNYVLIALTLATTALFLNPSLGHAEVSSMSVESFRDIEGERYWLVAVSCKDQPAEKLMKKVIGGDGNWCSVDEPLMCNNSKFSLSKDLCGATIALEQAATATKQDSTPSQPKVIKLDPEPITPIVIEGSNASAAVSTPAQASDKELRKTELLREQVRIEEQRILIEQSRLELTRKELQLKKQSGN